MDMHGLHVCHRTSRAALEVLHRRFEFADAAGAGDLRPRLVMEMLVAAFRYEQGAWVPEPGMPVRGDLVTHVRNACAALPGSLTLTAGPRAGE